jgi:hypothetical protein
MPYIVITILMVRAIYPGTKELNIILKLNMVLTVIKSAKERNE